MTQELTYQTTECVTYDKQFPLDLFFKDWLSENCIGDYTVTSSKTFDNSLYYRIKVTFDESGDAIMMKLRGPPDDLSRYIVLIE